MADYSTIPWNQLPDHLTENIISRLPLKSLLWLLAVSKGWKSLFISKPFLQNPCLLLCSSNLQRPCFVYSFHLQSWQTLSLSFLREKCGIEYKRSPSLLLLRDNLVHFSLVTSSGLLLVDMHVFPSNINPYTRLCVCNPLTGNFRKLPKIPNRVLTVLARGIADGDGDEGYKVIILGISSRNSVELQLYDSALGLWRTIPVTLPIFPAMPDKEMIFSGGKFYYLGLLPPGILAIDVNGPGNCTVLPMPNGNDEFSWLLTCRGSVLLMGARKDEKGIKDLIMWQYCDSTWREIAKMGSSLCEEFKTRRWLCRWTSFSFECMGVGDNVCFKACGNKEVLVYSMTRGLWTWLPTCPSKHGDLYWKSLPIQPKLHMRV